MITYICEKCGLKTNTSVCPHCGGRSAIDKSELFWCSHCNIPTYDEICPICGNKGKYFTSDARPVFPEERLLLIKYCFHYSIFSIFDSSNMILFK